MTATKTNRRPATRAKGTKGQRDDGTEAEGERKEIDFDTFAEIVDLLGVMFDDSAAKVPDSPYACDMGCFVHNEGDARDRAEALLVLIPIVSRIYDRLCEAERAEFLKR